MTGLLCRVCGAAMLEDFFHDGMHPNCEPRAAARIRAADVARRKGEALGELGRRQALKTNPAASAEGLRIIREAARLNRVLSADTVRDEMDARQVPENARGGLWQSAVKAGLVRKVDSQRSGGLSAHGKQIGTYLSLLYVSERYGDAS